MSELTISESDLTISESELTRSESDCLLESGGGLYLGTRGAELNQPRTLKQRRTNRAELSRESGDVIPESSRVCLQGFGLSFSPEPKP